MKKHILFILLFFPFIVNAKVIYEFNEGKEQANNYINNFTKYNDYIITNAMYGYNGEIYQDANFNNGGFLNKYEFELSKDGTGNTYLFTGQNYWTMTKDNNKYYLINNNNLSLIEETQQQPIRITEYIKPMTRIKGSGTYMDPWMFLEPKEIKITYNNNGGSGCETKIVKQGDTFGTLCTPNKNNTSFLGWYTENSFRNEITDTSIINFDEDMILYAKWDGCNSGTYLNNATNQCENCPTSYTSNKGTTEITNCYINVSENYYIDNSDTSTPIPCIQGYHSQSHTVNYGSTSSCTPNNYTIKYNANGGSGSMSDTSCEYAKNCKLRKNSYSNGNDIFIGWATSSNTTTATYTDEQNVNNLTSSNNGTINLYAVWKKSDVEPPQCTLKVTTSGIQFNTKTDNIGISEYGIGTSTTPSYNSKETISLAAGTYYGYVKDAAGNEGICQIVVARTSSYSCNCSDYSYSCNCSSYTYDCNCKTESYSCNCRNSTYQCNCKTSSYSCNCSCRYYTSECDEDIHHRPINCQQKCASWGNCQTCTSTTCDTCSGQTCDTCNRQSCSTCSGRSCDTCYSTSCSTCYKCNSGYNKLNDTWCYK